MSPTDEEHRVTALELFFDLVFVYALTQVAALLYSHDGDWQWVVRATLVLGFMWWPWVGFTWAYNLVRADRGAARLILVAAMAAMMVLSVAIPGAFDGGSAGSSGATVFVGAYLVVRMLHLSVFLLAGSGDLDVLAAVVRFAIPMSVGVATLAVASAASGWVQTALWGLALILDYGLVALSGAQGWVITAPGHFAERHGLVIIVALGESVVSMGAGASTGPISAPVIAASVMGIVILACLWWTYFDVVSVMAERRLRLAHGAERAAIGRDSYSYLHLPMVGGIVFLAFGLKETLTMLAADGFGAQGLTGASLAVTYGGVAFYLLAHVAFRLRNARSLSTTRLCLAVALLASALVAGGLPAFVQLAALTAGLMGLVAVEALLARADATQHPK
jgi:low temperature requirement protein LtrA